MKATNGFVATMMVALGTASAGCAAQSDAFRQMSARDHETAARSSQDSALAQQHLDAARELRYQEQVACDGVPDADRRSGAFAQPEHVTAVEVVRDRILLPKGPIEPVGVSVYLKAEPGMTQQWLGRLVTCYAAHAAAEGTSIPRSPLSVRSANLAIASTAVGFRLTVVSKDRDVARAVVDRGQELAASLDRRPAPTVVGLSQ